MIAIITKTLPATDTRGCRIIATVPVRDPRKRVTLGYDYAASNHDNHVAAAEAYRKAYFSGTVIERAATAQSALNAYTHIYG